MSAESSSEPSPYFRRIALSAGDIDEAVGFASALRRSVETPIESSGERRLVRQALTAAFLIAYMRPFKRSRADGATARALDIGAVRGLNESQVRLHARLEKIRDEIIAHADPAPRELRIDIHPDWGRVPTSRLVDVAFSPEAAAELQELAEAVRAWVFAELAAGGSTALIQE